VAKLEGAGGSLPPKACDCYPTRLSIGINKYFHQMWWMRSKLQTNVVVVVVVMEKMEEMGKT
jgi:phosphopantetheinyl transferase